MLGWARQHSAGCSHARLLGCGASRNHAGSRLPVQVSLANNVGLCGMIPNSVRFAHGFNTYNTGLGEPCPGDTAYPPQLAYASYAWPI